MRTLATSLRICVRPEVGYWAGGVLAPGRRLVLLTPDAEAAEAGRQLLRVGFRDSRRVRRGASDAWRAAGFPVPRVIQISALNSGAVRARWRLTSWT